MSYFEDAKLILTPNAYKAGKAYSIKPFDGSGDLTVVRNTTATRVDENGLIEVVGANVPRLNYPIGGGCPSWLLEPQATNLLTHSENFSNASWQKISTTINNNAILAPDDTITADKLIASAVAGSHRVADAVTLNDNQDYVLSVFAKKSEYNYIALQINPKSNVFTATIFDLNAGVVVGQPAGATAPIESNIEDLGNGWFRCSVKINSSTGVATTDARIFVSNNSTSVSFTGDGTSGIYIWGAQLEQGGLTSYIPTNGTAVTRNADVFSKTGISSLIGQTEGSVYAELELTQNTLGQEQAIFEISDGTTNNRVILSKTSSGDDFALVTTFNDSGLLVRTNIVESIGYYKIAAVYSSTFLKLFINGVKHEFTFSPRSFSESLDELYIGSRQNTDRQLNSLLGKLILFDTAKSDAELINLTTI